MTPAAFIEQWSDSRLRERQGSQEHFIDLRRLRWILEGATGRVTMIGFGRGLAGNRLNGFSVDRINADLTATSVDSTKARLIGPNQKHATAGR